MQCHQETRCEQNYEQVMMWLPPYYFLDIYIYMSITQRLGFASNGLVCLYITHMILALN